MSKEAEKKSKELYPERMVEREIPKHVGKPFIYEEDDNERARKAFIKGYEFANQDKPQPTTEDGEVDGYSFRDGLKQMVSYLLNIEPPCSDEMIESYTDSIYQAHLKSTQTQDKVREILKQVSELHPYKQQGNRDSYSQYNEGCQDAIGSIEGRLNQLINEK